MFSDKLISYFQDMSRVGELGDSSVQVEVSNPACGDILQLAVEIADGRVSAARFRARGCTASMAAGAAVAEWVEGRTRAELAAARAEEIEERLGGLPAASKHSSVLATDAVKALLRAAGQKL